MAAKVFGSALDASNTLYSGTFISERDARISQGLQSGSQNPSQRSILRTVKREGFLNSPEQTGISFKFLMKLVLGQSGAISEDLVPLKTLGNRVNTVSEPLSQRR